MRYFNKFDKFDCAQLREIPIKMVAREDRDASRHSIYFAGK